MNRFTKNNLRNIRQTFEIKTGVNLNVERRVSPKKTKYLLLAAALCALLLASCARTLFSGLNGDDLSLKGTYLGDGIVSIEVVNRSDKALEFQKQVKLMGWRNGEVEPLPGGTVRVENTRFPAHSGGTMLVDLSEAYDIKALENGTWGTLEESGYYLILTNHDFLFGHDWMCFFHFSEPAEEITPTEPETPPEPAPAQNLDGITDDLKSYFEDTYLDEPPTMTQAHFEYQQKVQELLARTNGTLVHPVDPHVFVQTPREQVFDETLPMDIQYQMVIQQYHSLDAFNRMVGAAFSGTGSDQSLQIMAALPEYQGQTDGGQCIPVVYLFVYERAALTAENPYAFIYGNIIPFSRMEQDKVYEDDRYVIYDMTDLFYTDLDAYLDDFVSVMKGKVSLYFDEQIRRRVHNVYDYFRDAQTLPGLIENHQAEMETMGHNG